MLPPPLRSGVAAEADDEKKDAGALYAAEFGVLTLPPPVAPKKEAGFDLENEALSAASKPLPPMLMPGPSVRSQCSVMSNVEGMMTGTEVECDSLRCRKRR